MADAVGGGGGIQINIINYRYLDLCNHNIEMVNLQSKINGLNIIGRF